MILKRITLGMFILHCFAFLPGFAQDKGADRITGVWLTKEEDAKVKIYECGSGEYCGKIIWTKNHHAKGNPKKKDQKNPDPDKRDRTIIGLNILKSLKYNESEEIWEDGSIYDPNEGETYNCYISMESPNKIKLRGYVGVSWLGRTSHWTRIRNHPKAD